MKVFSRLSTIALIQKIAYHFLDKKTKFLPVASKKGQKIIATAPDENFIKMSLNIWCIKEKAVIVPDVQGRSTKHMVVT